MLRKTIVRVWLHHLDGSRAEEFDDLDSYVCRGKDMKSLLSFLQSLDNVEKWKFFDDCSFFDEGRYLVILEQHQKSSYEIVVYNLDKIRHDRRHGRRIELIWEW